VQTLILGLGNLLLGDEGVGVHAARALADGGLPAGVAALDAGTALLEALPDLETADLLIVVDAMRGGGPPGTVYRLDEAALARNGCIASLHGFDLPRVLALTRRRSAPRLVVFGVEPELIDWSLELSPRVAGSLPALLSAVRAAVSPGEPGPPGRSSPVSSGRPRGGSGRALRR
jgi:hydrogenase maturation protease